MKQQGTFRELELVCYSWNVDDSQIEEDWRNQVDAGAKGLVLGSLDFIKGDDGDSDIKFLYQKDYYFFGSEERWLDEKQGRDSLGQLQKSR